MNLIYMCDVEVPMKISRGLSSNSDDVIVIRTPEEKMLILLDHYCDTIGKKLEPPDEQDFEEFGKWKAFVKTLVEKWYKNPDVNAAIATPEILNFYLKYGMQRGYQQSILLKPSSAKKIWMNVHGKVSAKLEYKREDLILRRLHTDTDEIY